MQLRKPLQYLQEYLDQNPDKREVYVNCGLVAAKLVVAPVNRLLKHLVEISHLDRNKVPYTELLKSPYLFSSGQISRDAYDDDFNDEKLAKIYEKIRQAPPSPPVEEYTRFVSDDSAFELDPLDQLDRLKNVLDRLNRKLGIKEEYKPVPNVFRAAAENIRDDLSIEDAKKLMDRTETLKKAYPKPKKVSCPIKKVCKTIKTSPKNRRPAFDGCFTCPPTRTSRR